MQPLYRTRKCIKIIFVNNISNSGVCLNIQVEWLLFFSVLSDAGGLSIDDDGFE